MEAGARIQGSMSTWIHQELALRILRDVADRCATAGIPFLAVKGVITARQLYDDVSQRSISDVDVRIRRCDFWRWRRMADRAGWPCWNAVWTFRSRSYEFLPLSLDVEADVGPPGMCALTVDEMLSRAEEVELAPGLRVLAPEIHDHAVLLAVNAYKDRFAVGNPHSRTDLDRMARHPRFRRDVFVERALAARIATIVWIVAACMAAGYDSQPWRAIGDAVERRARVDRGYARLYRRVAESPAVASIPAATMTSLGPDGAARRARALLTNLSWLAERWIRGRTGTHGRG
jgi:hypothetical protein